MKKGFILFVFSILLWVLASCSKKDMYSFEYYYMYTWISVDVFADSQTQANQMNDEIDSIYAKYHDITNNYEPLAENSIYLSNIYEINQTLNVDVEIDVELYEILEYANQIKQLTNGYFDISIGKIVDIWKNLALDEVDGYRFQELPESVFEAIMDELSEIEVITQPYQLTKTNDKHYIRILHEDVKLDLGAIAKGYATQKVYDYLKEMEREYFSISAGSSSISIGKNKNRDTGLYHVSLINPLKDVLDYRNYGMIYVSDLAINTSGNFEQYTIYQGKRYHHVVSPKTKMPMQYYHSVTILGQDAGLLDALTTALLNMPNDEFQQFITSYQDTYDLEVIRFNEDVTISTFMIDTLFEDKRP